MAKEVFINVPDVTRLYICKNSDSVLYITISGDDLERLDLTGCFVYFTVKRRLSDTDALAVFQKITPVTADITDPSMGLVKISLSAAETLLAFPDWYYEYVFDMKVKDPLGKIISNSCGTLGVYPTATKTIT